MKLFGFCLPAYITLSTGCGRNGNARNSLVVKKVQRASAAKRVPVTITPKSLVVRVLRLWRIAHWQEYASFDSLLSLGSLWHLGNG